MLSSVDDTFSYDAELSHEIANSVGMSQKAVSEHHVKSKENLECDQLRVEADSWYTLGKCLLNAFSKL